MRQLLLFLSVFIAYSTATSSPSVCTNGFTLVNNKCLALFPLTTSHKRAERTCMDYGATLVTLRNAIDNNALANFIGTSASLVWIGAYCFGNDPSSCQWDDSLGPADLYDNFSNGYPRTEVGKCVYYSVQGALAGKWLSGNCDQDSYAFVCELPPTHADNCTYNYGGHCYTFHNTLSSFSSAQMTCEQECGTLTSITSPNENRYLTTQLTSTYYYLIGGQWPAPNILSWVDGSVWTYNNIDTNFGQRGMTCMALSGKGVNNDAAAGFWTSVSCNSVYSFICKRPAGKTCNGSPPPVVVTPIPSNPSYCNSSLLAPGVITSPHFPSNYDNNLYCQYRLATIGSYNVLLKFLNFITELNYDKVYVYDGDSTNSELVATLSGSNLPDVIVSTGNTLTVVFTTDGSNVYQGFSARVLPYTDGRFTVF